MMLRYALLSAMILAGCETLSPKCVDVPARVEPEAAPQDFDAGTATMPGTSTMDTTLVPRCVTGSGDERPVDGRQTIICGAEVRVVRSCTRSPGMTPGCVSTCQVVVKGEPMCAPDGRISCSNGKTPACETVATPQEAECETMLERCQKASTLEVPDNEETVVAGCVFDSNFNFTRELEEDAILSAR